MDMQIEPKVGQKVKFVRKAEGVKEGEHEFLQGFIGDGKTYTICDSYFHEKHGGWWVRVNEKPKWIYPIVMFDLVEEELKMKKPEDAPKAKPAKKDQFKFQVGDRVKVIRWDDVEKQFGGRIGEGQKDKYLNKVFTVTSQDGWLDDCHCKGYRLFPDEMRWMFDERLLRRVRKAKPAIPMAALVPPPPVKQRDINDAVVGDWVVGKQGEDAIIAGKVFQITRISHLGQPLGFQILYLVDELEKPAGPGYYRNRFDLYLAKPAAKEPKKEPVKKPVIDSSHIPLILKELTRQVVGNAGTCSYAKHLVGSEESVFKFQVRDACHARLPHYDYSHKYDQVALNVGGHLNGIAEKSRPSYRAFVEYITTQSPWKACFLHKSIGQTMKWGILMDVSKPMPDLFGAAVALRGGSEFSSELPLFQKIIDEGYSGHSAYLLSQCVNKQHNGYAFSGIRNHHRVFSGGLSFEGIVKFFREGYTLTKEKPPAIQNGKAAGIAEHIANFEDDKTKQLDTVLKDLLKYKEVKEGWGARAVPIQEEAIFAAACELDKLFF